MIHYKTWYWLQEINDAIVPGPGQLVGFGKKDVFGPIDLIPVVGPVRKLHKISKVWKHRRKVKQGVYWGLNLAADVFAVKEGVDWYNNRYRMLSEIGKESSPAARSGNAEGPGGGTKKKRSKRPKRYHLPVGSKRAWKKGHNPCDKGYYPRKIKGKWYCVLK